MDSESALAAGTAGLVPEISKASQIRSSAQRLHLGSKLNITNNRAASKGRRGTLAVLE